MPFPFPGIPRKAVDRPPLFFVIISVKKSACKDFFAPDFNNTGRCARGVRKRISGFYFKAAFRAGRRLVPPDDGRVYSLLQEKVIGGIYDDRLLVKPVKAARHLMPGAPYEVPYEGGGQMLLVEEADDWEFLQNLFRAIYDQLPPPKKRK